MKKELPLSHHYFLGGRSEFEGHLELTSLHSPHQDYHLVMRQHAKSIRHHETRLGSTERTDNY